MKAIDVIKNELECVQRDCCRVENQCNKCDLVLPIEEIISAYKKCISLLEKEELEQNVDQLAEAKEILKEIAESETYFDILEAKNKAIDFLKENK